jgi:glycosyltransferase involved in cell wall biosynthesis
MISVIACSRRQSSWDFHQRNVAKTIGCDYEYIRVDNTSDKYGICAAYNYGVSQAKGDIYVFVHEDVFFMEPGWGNVIESKFLKNEKMGLLGVAGTQYLFSDHPAWIRAGMPFIRGRVVHELDNGATFVLTVFSLDKTDAEVVAVDGLFFAIRANLFPGIRFDDMTFDRFHFYDLDICMQVRKTHSCIVTWDILLKHLSGGQTNADWIEAGRRFLLKYKNELPASTAGEKIPDLSDIKLQINVDIKGKVAQGIIC